MEERFGRWRIGRKIARGDLAEVVLADDDRGGGSVAIKRLHPHVLTQAEVVELFAAERALACALPPHPNLVRGLEHGVVDHRPYLAMTHVPGDDLRALRDAGEGRAAARAIVVQAASACAHLHAQGFVHGDVGPANLIRDEDGHVVLCDMGVTRPIATDGPVRGTHAYMAPEQIRGEPWSAATDVFALGVVLWELVAGQRLFHRGPSYLTMAAVMEAEIPPLADRELDPIVRAALARVPAHRIPTAAELLARLGAPP